MPAHSTPEYMREWRAKSKLEAQAILTDAEEAFSDMYKLTNDTRAPPGYRDEAQRIAKRLHADLLGIAKHRGLETETVELIKHFETIELSKIVVDETLPKSVRISAGKVLLGRGREE